MLNMHKTLSNRDYVVLIAEYVEYLSEELSVPSADFEAQSRLKYASLLRNYRVVKFKKGYVSENNDPPRSRPSYVPPLEIEGIFSSE
ncbi:hypothetical protein BC332_11103 [Capsicum chinense]|nr:hypothetical protein BC332_11103 [Capsicum chinense]